MFSIDAAFAWLAATAGIGLIVLGVSAALTWCWERPIERLRCIQGTFVGLIAALLMQQLQLLPQLDLGWLPSENRPAAATTEPALLDDVAGSSRISPPMPTAGLDPRMEGMRPAISTDRAAADSERQAAKDNPAQSPERNAGAPALTTFDFVRIAILGVLASGAAWSVGQTIVGILRLRKLLCSCTPASAEIVAVLNDICGSQARRSAVLVSPEIDVPLTFGFRRAMIVLPSAMSHGASRSTLRHCLAHEWCHAASYDVAQWWVLQALQPLLWYQPFYWLLRREMRLCQDQLADHFATSQATDRTSYADVLIGLAKVAQRRRLGLALTMNDGHTHLFRRIELLLSENYALAATCRAWPISLVAALLMATTVLLSFINLGHAESSDPTQEKQSSGPAAAAGTNKPQTNDGQTPVEDTSSSHDSPSNAADAAKPSGPDPSIIGEELPDGSLRYSGVVVDKTTGQPIQGAMVSVRRQIVASWDRRIVEETKHRTDERGRYTFEIPPDQLAQKNLYIELDVEHPNYATKANFGYTLAMIRKNATLGDPPFFSRVQLDPAEFLTGRILAPDGQSLADVPILAYSNVNPRDYSNDNFGSFFRTRSGQDGTFRLNVTRTGPSVFWIVPEQYAPLQIVSAAKRGDWGDIQLKPGVEVSGQVVDAEGKPVPGVWVNLTDKKSQSEIAMPVASGLRRSGRTNAEGKFNLAPLAPGEFEIEIASYPEEIRYYSHELKRVELPAVFPRRNVTIGRGQQEPIIVQAVPTVSGQYVDGQGKPRPGGWEVPVSGEVDGGWYSTFLRPRADGRIEGLLPHGLTNARLSLVSNEHGALRIRLGKDKPLIHGYSIPLGTVESDITDVEIFRYTAPIVKLKVVDEQGQLIPGAKIAGIYTADSKEELGQSLDGMPTSISFEKQPGGIFRSSQMLPDEETRFVASAQGYQDAEETISLAEGVTHEPTLVLRRSDSSENGDAAPSGRTGPPEQ